MRVRARFFYAATLLAALCVGSARAREHTWIVLSDIHEDPYASFEFRSGDTGPQLWKLTLRALKEHGRDADLVVLGGDMLAHHWDALSRAHERNSDDAAIALNAALARDLGAAFPRAQFVIALGNNDDPCGDYLTENGGAYARRLAAVWAPLLARADRGEAAASMAHGGYYGVALRGTHARALVLNSVMWSFVYRGSCERTRGAPSPDDQLEWLRHELATTTQPVVLFMHIPPGYDATSTSDVKNFVAVPFLRSDRNAHLLDILATYRARIAFGIAAHVHRYSFRDAGGVPMLIAPSISPIYHNHPAFVEMRVDDRARVLDIAPYVFDPFDSTFTRRESFAQTYGVNGFTQQSLRDATSHIMGDADARARWVAAYDLWTPRMGDIADHDWLFFACAQAETGSGFTACTRSWRLLVTPWIAAAALAGAIAIVFAIIARRRARRRARR